MTLNNLELGYDWLIDMLGTSMVVLGALILFMGIIYALGKLLAKCLDYIMARMRVFNELRYYLVYRTQIRKWVEENKEQINKDFNNL